MSKENAMPEMTAYMKRKSKPDSELIAELEQRVAELEAEVDEGDDHLAVALRTMCGYCGQGHLPRRTSTGQWTHSQDDVWTNNYTCKAASFHETLFQRAALSKGPAQEGK